MTINTQAPAPSAEARRLIDELIGRVRSWKDHADAEAALSAYVAGLEADVVRLRDVLEPFVRADRALGAEPGPFRFETANGYRLIERDHLRAAGIAAHHGRAAQEKPHAL